MKFELFNAILSMDSYHRGYDRGINLPNILNSTQIGVATITQQSNIDPNGDAVGEGFYALAYDIGGVGKIIAYRGTDYPSSGDAGAISDLDDWLQGGGTPGGQSAMAIQFYQSVADANNENYQLATIMTTGHSLGGGLAGLVGAIYGKDGILFDNMAFEVAADNVKSMAENSTSLRNDIYDGQTPWDTDNDGLQTYSIEGEILNPNRTLQETDEIVLDLGVDVQFGDYSYWNIITNIVEVAGAATARHSMSTLAIRMFADEDYIANDRSWEHSAKYFWKAMYDPSLASSIGFQDFNYSEIQGQYQLNGQYADIMRTAIAYSAIDYGTTIFGDTAIRALYNDANDLGQALDDASYLTGHAESLSEVLVHYAGLLALNKIEHAATVLATGLNVKEGVLDYQQGHLSISFSDALWGTAQGTAVAGSIFSRVELVEGLASASGVETELHAFLGIVNDSTSFDTISNIKFKNSETYGFILADTSTSIAAGNKTSLYVGRDVADAIDLRVRDVVVFAQGGDDLIKVSNVDGYYFIDGGADDDTLEFYDIYDFAVEQATNEIVSSSGRIIYHNIEHIINHPVTLIKNDGQVTPNPGGIYNTYDYTSYVGSLSTSYGDFYSQGIIGIRGSHKGDILRPDLNVAEVHLGYGDDIAYQDALVTTSSYTTPIFAYYGGNDTLVLSPTPEEANWADIVLNDTIVLDDITFGGLNTVGSSYQTTISIANHGSLKLTNLPVGMGVFVTLMTGGGLRVEVNNSGVLETEKLGSTLTPLYTQQTGTWGDDVWYARHSAKNVYTALGGDDTFHTKDGSDEIIYAGEGIDTAIFSGNVNQYQFFNDKGYLLVKKGTEMNALLGTEFLVFDNGTYEVANLSSQPGITYTNAIVQLANENNNIIQMSAEILDVYASTYEGNDTIETGSGNDFIYAGTGDDVIDAGAGDDTYFWNVGDGYDVIYASEGFDTLQFGEGIALEDVTLEVFYDYSFSFALDLKIYIENDGGLDPFITIKNQYAFGDTDLERILFHDGQEIDLLAVQTIAGDGGNNELRGTRHREVFDPGAGDDYVLGNDGEDVFIYTSGNDVFDTYPNIHSGLAKIQMVEGIQLSDLSFERTSDDLLITISGKGSITINDQYESGGSGVKFSEIMLHSGELLDMSALPYTYFGLDHPSYPDALTGTTADETFITYRGNDIIYADGGDDTIIGGDGSDTIHGEDGTDTAIFDGLYGSYASGEFDVYHQNAFITYKGSQIYTNVTHVRIWDPATSFVTTDKLLGVEVLEFSNGLYDVATQTFTTFPVNEPPIAQDDAFTLDENTSVFGNVLDDNGYGPDSDGDGDTLTVVAGVYTTTYGSLVLDLDGSFTYTPNAEFFGTDVFDYTVEDGNNGSDTGTVTFTVNEATPSPPQAPATNRVYLLEGGVSFGVLASSPDINEGAGYLQKTHSIAFLTGGDVTTAQMIYEQGGRDRGLNMLIDSGKLYAAVWNHLEEAWGYKELSVDVTTDTKYTATLVMDGVMPSDGTVTLYLDGVEVDTLGGVGQLYTHSNGIGIGNISENSEIHDVLLTTSTPFLGSIERIVHYNDALSGTELTELQDYMGYEWLNVSPPSEPEAPMQDLVILLDDGVTQNTYPSSVDVNLGSGYLQKTHSIAFETGSDVTTAQMIYEQGGRDRGLNMLIDNGKLYAAVWNHLEEAWGYKELSVDVTTDTKYTATLVMDGVMPADGTATLYLDGVEVDTIGGVGQLYMHGNGIGIGNISENSEIHDVLLTTSTPFLGSIEKVVQYNAALAGTMLDDLHAYLAYEWTDASGAGANIVSITSNIPDILDPSVETFSSYSDQDTSGIAAVTTTSSVLLDGNSWKKMALSFAVTPDTVLEFDFSSTQEGEIHGIGIDNNNAHQTSQLFELYGTQDWGNTDFETYDGSGAVTHFKIDIGSYFAPGVYSYLTFANDNDTQPAIGNSLFENIRIYDEVDPVFDSVYTGVSGEDVFKLEEMPNTSRVYKIENFNSVEDVLDLSSLLDPITSAIMDFVQITDDGADSFVAVDRDGGGDNFVAIATLTGVTGLTDEDALEAAGVLIAA